MDWTYLLFIAVAVIACMLMMRMMMRPGPDKNAARKRDHMGTEQEPPGVEPPNERSGSRPRE